MIPNSEMRRPTGPNLHWYIKKSMEVKLLYNSFRSLHMYLLSSYVRQLKGLIICSKLKSCVFSLLQNALHFSLSTDTLEFYCLMTFFRMFLGWLCWYRVTGQLTFSIKLQQKMHTSMKFLMVYVFYGTHTEMQIFFTSKFTSISRLA